MRIVAVDAAEVAERCARARCEPNPRTRVRLLGVADALDGMPIAAVAGAVGVGRSTLDDWLGRYRAGGVDGLCDRPRSGRPRLLTSEREAAVKARIEAGADHTRDGVVAFRGIDMHRLLKAEFKVKAGLASVYQLAHRLGLAWLATWPQHPKSELKIGAQVRKSVRRIKVAMASACPYPGRGPPRLSLPAARRRLLSAPVYRDGPHRGPPPHAQNSTSTSTSRREQPDRAPGIPFPSNRRRAHPL